MVYKPQGLIRALRGECYVCGAELSKGDTVYVVPMQMGHALYCCASCGAEKDWAAETTYPGREEEGPSVLMDLVRRRR